MATTITGYNHLPFLIGDDGGLAGLDNPSIYVALVTSSYTFSASHTQWSDASSNEVASGSGYTTGGAAIGAAAVTDVGSGVAKLDGNDVTWSALTKTFRRAVAYASGSIAGLTDPVLFSILFNDAPADVTVNGVDFTIVWHSSGIITLSLA